MNRLLMASLASNTTKAYAVGLQAFDQFRLNQQLSILWPPPSNHILMFIAHLSIQGCKQTTARAYTSAIAFKCKVLGNGDPTKHFLVGKVLEGMKRQNNNRDVRMPITLEILNQILHKLPVVCQDTYETSLFSAAFTLAYYALLRVGELALSKGNSPDRIIQVQHISIQHSIINLLIKYSKTDQLGKGTHLRINATDTQFCPVKIMNKYLQVRPNVTGPLFCHYSGQPLTRYQFSSVLAKALQVLGINSKYYKSHSFRIGAATMLAQQGLSEQAIQASGRWHSQAYRSYIR